MMKRSFFPIPAVLAIFISFSAEAFEWPRNTDSPETIKSYFGQKRGSKLSTSIIFSEDEENPAEITATQKGTILVTINGQQEDDFFFPSTLGASVLQAHEDGLISVYANLRQEEKEFLDLENAGSDQADSPVKIGVEGNTAWHKIGDGLEFQLLDTQKDNALNPRLLLPRGDNETALRLSRLFLEGKSGDALELKNNRVLQSGTYRIFCTRNPTATPYKTEIIVNGVTADSLSYDIIGADGRRLYVAGIKKYTSTELFPDETSMLLGTATLPPGRSTLGITVSDRQGNSRHLDYTLTLY